MYFKRMPKIYYDSMNTGQPKVVTNIMRRVAVRAKVKTNTLLFDTYEVKEGETPESIAHKLYGDTELHWIVLMMNNVVDRFHQWPLNFSQFNQFLADKYDNVDGVHHYELPQSSGDTDVKIEVYNSSALYTGDDDYYGTATTITNREYEQDRQDELRQIRLLDPRYVEDFVEEYTSLMKESII